MMLIRNMIRATLVRRSKLLVFAMMAIVGCVEPYKPVIREGGATQMVVDGYLNGLTGAATIRLSESTGLYSGDTTHRITRAKVLVASDHGESAVLQETSPGEYTLNSWPITSEAKYRLEIQTSDGVRFESTYAQPLQAPPIDSLTWELDSFYDGVNIQLYAHDVPDNSRYYRWEYDETWQYQSAYRSELIYNPQTVALDRRTDDIFNCWHSLSGTKILIATSKNLIENRISGLRIIHIPEESPKVLVRYSILVRQFAISGDEYLYWERLKKNTENLGTLFDPLPGNLSGNIVSTTHPDKVAIGFFSVVTPSEKRLFVDNRQIPANLAALTGYQKCVHDTLTLEHFSRDLPGIGSVYLFTSIIYNHGFISGYGYSTRNCVDCRLTGGTTQRPPFW